MAFQFKNESNTTLRELFLTLHPACQYLTDPQRQVVANKDKETSLKRFEKLHNNCGAGYADWLDYTNFFNEYPNLFQKWICVGVCARVISRIAYADLAKSTTSYDADQDTMLVLSLNSPKWLSKNFRKALSVITKGEAMTDQDVIRNAVPVSDAVLIHESTVRDLQAARINQRKIDQN